MQNDCRQLANKILGLHVECSDEADKEIADIVASLTPAELRGLQHEYDRRAAYDRSRPNRGALQLPPLLAVK